MDKVNGKLTVFFEEPFWVGIFEPVSYTHLDVYKRQGWYPVSYVGKLLL